MRFTSFILPGHSQDKLHNYNTFASVCCEIIVGDAPSLSTQPLRDCYYHDPITRLVSPDGCDYSDKQNGSQFVSEPLAGSWQTLPLEA